MSLAQTLVEMDVAVARSCASLATNPPGGLWQKELNALNGNACEVKPKLFLFQERRGGKGRQHRFRLFSTFILLSLFHFFSAPILSIFSAPLSSIVCESSSFTRISLNVSERVNEICGQLLLISLILAV